MAINDVLQHLVDQLFANWFHQTPVALLSALRVSQLAGGFATEERQSCDIPNLQSVPASKVQLFSVPTGGLYQGITSSRLSMNHFVSASMHVSSVDGDTGSGSSADDRSLQRNVMQRHA